MPKGYWIARVAVSDPGRYAAYAQALPRVVEDFGGRFLVAGSPAEVPEGEARERNVVIEFPDLATAKACWHSPAYETAAALRIGTAIVDVIIIEGVA